MKNEELSSRPLYRMFTSVPGRYDLMNRLLTLGMDQVWRKKAARMCLGNHPRRVLDLCTGTGDLAIHLRRMADAETEIHALDFSEPMLGLAINKSRGRKTENIKFIKGDVAGLPFEDDYFDSIGITFAFRNLTFHNPLSNNYLSEIRRVLRPGGQCIIVETGQPRSRFIKSLYHRYLNSIVAGAGGALSGNPAAYRYLANSARNYYSVRELSSLILHSGFGHIEHFPLLFNIISIYRIIK